MAVITTITLLVGPTSTQLIGIGQPELNINQMTFPRITPHDTVLFFVSSNLRDISGLLLEHRFRIRRDPGNTEIAILHHFHDANARDQYAFIATDPNPIPGAIYRLTTSAGGSREFRLLSTYFLLIDLEERQ